GAEREPAGQVGDELHGAVEAARGGHVVEPEADRCRESGTLVGLREIEERAHEDRRSRHLHGRQCIDEGVFVSDEVHARAERFGGRVAVRGDGADEMTYADWDRRANAVARGLRDVARKGDRVALLMTNDAACALQATYVGVLRAGAVAVVINPRY